MVNMMVEDSVEDMNPETPLHIPVMRDEVREALNLPEGGCLVDCTIGLAGHARVLAAQIGPRGRIIGIDRDQAALDIARASLGFFSGRCDFIHDDFRHIDRILDDCKVLDVDGILFDLGVSSLQLDNPERGFSIKADGPLDMRMNQADGLTAYDLINTLSEQEIGFILKDYGEERFFRRIAHAIVEERKREPIRTTGQLGSLVLKSLPRGYQRQRLHPATRTFQALRIMVNWELESLQISLDKIWKFLKPGGRVAVLAFHSLEDRIVKRKFKALVHEGHISLLSKKPLLPTEDEMRINPRARSARLRVVEKI